MPIPVFSGTVSCACGARYERADVQLPIKDIGSFECQCCGAVVERWSGRVVPMFRLIAKPETKTSSAA